MMNKILTTAILLLFVRSAIAQKGIDNLIQAEKDFAAYSVAHSTKEAFQKFIDSNSIMFDNGKPVSAIEFWNKREKKPGVLNWRPQYASIAASGDFGYTTGPWTFQASINDTIAARGQYTTVWHINKNGEWKFLVDLGVNNTPVETDTTLDRLNYLKLKRGSESSMLIAERELISQSKDSAMTGYFKKMWGMSVLNRNESLPQVARWKPETFKSDIQYTINGSGIASSGDMGYVYGTTVINGKTDNYLRIWQKEKTGWKIAVEVLRY
jgi:ketosteroid isomerase-like protein